MLDGGSNSNNSNNSGVSRIVDVASNSNNSNNRMHVVLLFTVIRTVIIRVSVIARPYLQITAMANCFY